MPKTAGKKILKIFTFKVKLKYLKLGKNSDEKGCQIN